MHKNTPIRKKLAIRSVAELAGLALSAISMIYVSRVIGPEYLGFSAITGALMLFLSRIADGGLTALATQRLARDDEKLDALLTITMPPKMLASVLLIAATVLVANLVKIDPRFRYFMTISVFALFFEACTPVWVFVALGRIQIASVIRIGQSLLAVAAIVVFIHEPADWKYLPYLFVFNACIGFGSSAYLLRRFDLSSFDAGLFKNDYVRVLRSYYREALYFLKAELSVFVYMSSDRIVLYYFTNPYTVGLYEAAYKIINPFYKISEVITPTMFRDLAQAFKRGEIHSIMSTYVFAMSIFTFPIGFFLLLFSDSIVGVFYGPQFAGSGPCLMVLGFVITFGFTSGIMVLPFSAWNMSREYGNSVFYGNIANIMLNVTLIPIYGALGAASATLGAKLIVTAVGFAYFRKATDYPIMTDFLYFIVASSVPLLFILAFSHFSSNNWLHMIVYGCVYFSMILVIYKSRFHSGQRPVTS